MQFFYKQTTQKFVNFIQTLNNHVKTPACENKVQPLELEKILEIMKPIVYQTTDEQDEQAIKVQSDQDVSLLAFLYKNTNQIPSFPDVLPQNKFVQIKCKPAF
jgi:hypothetical protein